MSIEFVLVLTTLPADADAELFASALIESGVVACVSILPVAQSVYRWQGAVERASERQLLLKTTSDRTEDLWERLRELHPYEVPEFLVLPVTDGHEAYLRWITDSTRTL